MGIKKIGVVMMIFLLSMSASTIVLAKESNDGSTTTRLTQNDSYAVSLPKVDKKLLNSLSSQELTYTVERSTEATVIDENGNELGSKVINKTEGNTENNLAISAVGEGRLVSVLIAADEEYRAAHSDWQTKTAAIVEAADDAFNRDFEIDLDIEVFRAYSSSGTNKQELLEELGNGGTHDLVIGFTADSNMDVGGRAYVYNSAPTTGYSIVLDQGDTFTAYAVQHEVSHNYGLNHDSQNSGIVCIMNYDYAYSVTTWDTDHENLIKSHKAWYGTAVN